MNARATDGRDARVRPLRHWSAQAIGRVEEALDRLLAEWARRWCTAAPTVVCRPADAAMNAAEVGDRTAVVHIDWHRIDAAPGLAWLGTAGDRRVAMRRMLAPADRSLSLPPLAAALAHSAWADLLARLGGLIAPAGRSPDRTDAPVPPAPPETDRRPWAGALVARWPHGSDAPCVLHLREPAARALAALGHRAPVSHTLSPAALRAAVAVQRATLRAVFTPVTVDVGSLLGLGRGDVLPLSHPLDGPLALHLVTDSGQQSADPIACAALGARGQRRALTLMRRPTKETP